MGNQTTLCCYAHKQDVEKDAKDIYSVYNNIQSQDVSESKAQKEDEGSLKSSHQPPHPKEVSDPSLQIEVPELSQAVVTLISKYGLSHILESSKTQVHRIDNSIYQGAVDDSEKPCGLGVMYHPNGSVFIGEFKEGIAQGEGLYALPDGSHYRGRVQNNRANDQMAYYKDTNTEYTGSVKNNKFEGDGHLKRIDCQFKGLFKDHKFRRGTLRWREKDEPSQWVYEGGFDENQKFTGFGYLKCPKGEYEGPFKNGLKHGKGTFLYKNRLTYEGEYINGVKQGNGTILKQSGHIAYSGNIEDGLPHGIGFVMQGHSKQKAIFEKGVNSQLIKPISPDK